MDMLREFLRLEAAAGVNWLQMAGVSFICGIGFTMSLFIAGLAFKHAGGVYYGVVRLSILIGSTLAATAGCLVHWIGFRHAGGFRRRPNIETSGHATVAATAHYSEFSSASRRDKRERIRSRAMPATPVPRMRTAIAVFPLTAT